MLENAYPHSLMPLLWHSLQDDLALDVSSLGRVPRSFLTAGTRGLSGQFKIYITNMDVCGARATSTDTMHIGIYLKFDIIDHYIGLCTPTPFKLGDYGDCDQHDDLSDRECGPVDGFGWFGENYHACKMTITMPSNSWAFGSVFQKGCKTCDSFNNQFFSQVSEKLCPMT